MIKLERIYVKNYKNIAEADLDLGNMNVIVGENGSGKSNLLSAIPFLNYFINGAMNEIRIGFSDGGFFQEFNFISCITGLNSSSLPMSLGIHFSDTDTNVNYNYKLVIEVNRDADSTNQLPKLLIAEESFSYKQRDKTGKPKEIFNRRKNEITHGSEIPPKALSGFVVQDFVSTLRIYTLVHNSSMIPESYRTAVSHLNDLLNSPVFYFSPHLLKNKEFEAYSRIRVIRYKLEEEIAALYRNKNFREAVHRLLGIKIEVVSLSGDSLKKEVRFHQRNSSGITLEQLSDGTILLLALITKIFSDSSDIFFIEEPENSIHPRALYELMKLIRERSLDKQFIITTHSPYLLNMIKPEEVLVAEIGADGLRTISKLPDVKAIKKRLSKTFMSFGDIVFAQPDNEDGEEKVY